MSTIPERQQEGFVAREIPARVLSVPSTVSPQIQVVVARPMDTSFNIAPANIDEWKAGVERAASLTVAGLPELREALGVTVEPTTIAGVRAYIVTPNTNLI